MAADKEDFDLVQEVLDQASSEVLIEQLHEVDSEWIEAIAEAIRNSRKHNVSESQIQSDVIHDVSGLLYKSKDRFWSPRSERFLVKDRS